MTTGCAQCGQCCQEIILQAPLGDVLIEWQEYVAACADTGHTPDMSQLGSGLNFPFMIAHWHLREDASLKGTQLGFSCDMYDPLHRVCTIHENRPPVCRGFPWYDDGVNTESIHRQYTRCSYWHDMPAVERPDYVDRPLLPITDITPHKKALTP
jgi:Fe-S-cluster containining protein